MTNLPLMPWPERVELTGETTLCGRLQFDGSSERRLDAGLARVNAALSVSAASDKPVPIAIAYLAENAASVPQLGVDESYELEIGRDAIELRSATIWGVLHALTTISQLLDDAGALPVGRLVDRPRFSWRGLMLDVARHFITVEALKRTVESMAFYKLNVLHLHLSDDQAFRFPSAHYPKLAATESYTAAELRDLVEFAADRGIRIVPELDMPGHVTSWLTAYPEWGTEPTAETNRFGVHKAALNAADEVVYGAIDELLGELSAIFPDQCIHLGGDEVHPGWWEEDPSVQSFMAARQLPTASALQGYFLARVAALAAARGRRVLGWDEVLNGGAPEGMIVQSWRGATARGRVLAGGHDCVDSSGYYLDLFYPGDVHYAYDPEAAERELLRLEDGLLDDPRLEHVADGLRWTHAWRDSAANGGGGRVLGGEACLWGELVDEPVLDVRLWSRMPMLAERFWSPALVTDADDAYARLAAVCGRSAELGLLALEPASDALLERFGVRPEQLDAVRLLEPIKWYGRLLGEAALAARLEGREMPQSRPYHVDTPLNRPVDALLPESFAARGFVADLQHSGARVRETCLRLLAVVEAGGFADELEKPIEQLGNALTVVLGVLDGSLKSTDARRALRTAGLPQGEYIVAIVPGLLDWLAEG